MSKQIEEKISRAANYLGATDLVDGRWAYHADEIGRYVVLEEDDLADLCDYLDHPNPQISGDAYSRWCAGTMSEEMPKGWEP